jgi:cysteinyl-tRNA synthetase
MVLFADDRILCLHSLHGAQSAFRAALCDSFNTPQALDLLRELVSATNAYINTQGTKNLNVRAVQDIAQWVGRMLRMFGLGEGERVEIGWGQEDEHGAGDFNVGCIHIHTLSFSSSLLFLWT